MEGYGWFGTAYFMYDIWSMYKVHTQKITDKLKLMRVTSNASFVPQNSNGHKNGGLYDKYIAKTFDKNGQRLDNIMMDGIMGKQTKNGEIENNHNRDGNRNLQQQEQSHKNCHYEDEIYDVESVQIPENGNWGFLQYVITHPVMMIHHVFVGTVGFLVVTYIRGGGHCIYSYMFMMEFSTPFVSLRSILSTLGLKNTRFYLINGLMMLFSFFICRVLMWPYVMWRYSSEIKATSIWQAIYGLPIGCIIGILILFLPQLYWFLLMIKGAAKVFFPSSKSFSSSPIVRAKSANDKLINRNCNGKYGNGTFITAINSNSICAIHK